MHATHSVLNAFRHHRNSHLYRGQGFPDNYMCSTPFGIIGILTRVDRTGSARRFKCSTPFGIIGILTAPVPTRLFAAPCKALFVHLFISLSHHAFSTFASLLFV